MPDHALKILGLAVICLYFIHLIRSWVLDLLFYRANNWEFSKDSGRAMYPGGGPNSMTGMAPLSNKTRVKFGYPFMISMNLIVIVIYSLSEF